MPGRVPKLWTVIYYYLGVLKPLWASGFSSYSNPTFYGSAMLFPNYDVTLLLED